MYGADIINIVKCVFHQELKVMVPWVGLYYIFCHGQSEDVWKDHTLAWQKKKETSGEGSHDLIVLLAPARNKEQWVLWVQRQLNPFILNGFQLCLSLYREGN